MDDQLNLYLERIQKAHPELTIKDVTLNQEGLINDVVIVNNALICRFGKHEWAAEDLQQEYNCLTLAQKYVDVRLPHWTWHADDFISYEMIPGIALQRYYILEADAGDQKALAEQLGTFLYQLHTIPKSAVKAHNVEPSVTNRSPERWLELYADVQRELFPYLMANAREWVHHHFSPLVKDPDFMECEQAFINGDLGTYHLLFNPATKRLNGIIDFGTAGIGDPACDLALIIDQFGEGFLRRISHYYSGVPQQIERARFWAGTLELQWLLGGLRNPDDPSWFAVHIGRARDAMPIGSGW